MDGNNKIDKERELYFSFFELNCGDEMKPYNGNVIINSTLLYRDYTLFYNGNILRMSEDYFSGTKGKVEMYLKEWASEKFNLKIETVI
jgi:hypothetical protein